MSPLQQLETYVAEIEDLASECLAGRGRALTPVTLKDALNGKLASELQKLVPLEARQAAGAFFTTGTLASRALQSLRIRRGVWDPACGGGDLLLGWCQQASASRNLPTTLERWGSSLTGFDTQPVFIRAARARIILAAVARGAVRDRTAVPLETWFPNIRCGDGLATLPSGELAADVVLNPPFVRIQAPECCTWATGSVSAAAVFVDHCINNSAPGTQLTAILPDVLRSGSRYRKWRESISRRASKLAVEIVGRFDPQVDVDVFILRMVVSKPGASVKHTHFHWGTSPSVESKSLGDYFQVSVGPVVPHRHEEAGPERPYLHAKNAPPNSTVTEIEEHRRFNGTVHVPPFVVVRRTSNPNDAQRPVATLVLGGHAVAVENHLIILKPKDGSLETCQSVMAVLGSRDTRSWLDEEIRCRHLTVGALQRMPWQSSGT